MLPRTQSVVSTADVVLFLIDARLGVTPDDKHFAQYVPVDVCDPPVYIHGCVYCCLQLGSPATDWPGDSVSE